MKLRCYALNEFPPQIVPASARRDWMDAFPDRHAYRCLPLSIANASGWEVLCPVPIEVRWTGGPLVSDLTVTALKPLPGGRPIDHFCRSNFSSGIVTFLTDYIFMTDPEWELITTGSFNHPKHNAYPLTGIIESDWLPYPFTMNWQITRPGKVIFDEGEPYCFVFPVRKQALLDCEVEIHRLADYPDLTEQHNAFRHARETFMRQKKEDPENAPKEAWQKHYFVGRHPTGETVDGHVNKLRLSTPVDFRAPIEKAETMTSTTPATTDESRIEVKMAAEPIEQIPNRQTEENLRGRARIDEMGRLTDRSKTISLEQARASGRADFVCVENFMSLAECAEVAHAFDVLKEKLFKSDSIDNYWNSRFVWLADIKASYPETGALLIRKQREAADLVSKFYRLTRPIYTDLTQIVQWEPGMYMRHHADNANPDGSEHKMAYRQFSGITYLNDDYEGGELYFTGLDIAIKPKAGMFLGFTAGFHHEHSVLRVESGRRRLTSPAFYTYEPERADRGVYPELFGEAP